MFHWVSQVVHSLLLPFNSSQSQSGDKEQSPVQHWLELTSGVTNWTRFDTKVEDEPRDGGNQASLSASSQLSSRPQDSIDDQASNRAAIKQWQEMVSAATGREVFKAEHPIVPDHVIEVGVDASDEVYEHLSDISDGEKTAWLPSTRSSGNSRSHDSQTENPLVDRNTSDESPAPHSSSMDPSGNQVVSELPTPTTVQDFTQLHPQDNERFVPAAYRPESVQTTAVNVMQLPADTFASQSVVTDPEWTPLPSFRNARSTLKGLPSRQIQCRAGSFPDSLWSD